MKKWSLILGAALLAGCGQGIVTTSAQPYNISLTPLGYEVDQSGKITIPAVTATLTATAGAHDIYDVQYTAVLLDSQGNPAASDNTAIVPASGSLFSMAKGGYYCYAYSSGGGTVTTPETQCTVNDPGASYVDNGFWKVNTVTNRAIVPGQWAIAHLNSMRGGTSTGGTSTGGTSGTGTSTGGTSGTGTSTGGTSGSGSTVNDGAGWYAQFTFTGKVDGKTVSWKQNYQFTNPAKAGT